MPYRATTTIEPGRFIICDSNKQNVLVKSNNGEVRMNIEKQRNPPNVVISAIVPGFLFNKLIGKFLIENILFAMVTNSPIKS